MQKKAIDEADIKKGVKVAWWFYVGKRWWMYTGALTKRLAAGGWAARWDYDGDCTNLETEGMVREAMYLGAMDTVMNA
jgi:hypothetical protein